MPIDKTVVPWRTPGGCYVDNGKGGRVVSYDATTATLRVAFPRGYVYDYFLVDPLDASDATTAEDPGCVINDRIRPAYPFLRVLPP